MHVRCDVISLKNNKFHFVANAFTFLTSMTCNRHNLRFAQLEILVASQVQPRYRLVQQLIAQFRYIKI